MESLKHGFKFYIYENYLVLTFYCVFEEIKKKDTQTLKPTLSLPLLHQLEEYSK